MKKTETKKYEFVKNLDGFVGTAKLWKIGTQYFVTSYVCDMAHETMMFAADESGDVTSWSDLGCIRDREAHEELIEEYIDNPTETE